MSCFQHDADDLLPLVRAGTPVLLDRRPEDEFFMVNAFVWNDAADCGHDIPAEPLTLSHRGVLADDVPNGFRCHGRCRVVNGRRQVLYRFRAAGAQVRDIRAQSTVVCEA